MVRLYTRMVKKRYLNQKRVYQYRYIAVPVPKKFHDVVQPFVGEDLAIAVAARPHQLTITLIPRNPVAKTLLHDE
jgi:hypothetical protein